MNFVEKNIKILYILTLCFSLTFIVMDLKMQILHSIMTLLQYISFLIVLVFWFKKRKELEYSILFKLFLCFFGVYSLIIFLDITIYRQFPLEDMLGCPKSIKDFIINTLVIFSLLLFLPLLRYVRRYDFLFNCFIILNTVSMFYLSNNLNNESLRNIVLMISCTTTSVALMVLVFKRKFFNLKMSKIFSCIVFLICIYVWIRCNKRGPILYFLLTYLLMFISKNRNNKKKVILFFFGVVLFIVLFQNIIVNILVYIAPELTDRFNETLVSGDTSGRLGDEDSGYALALRQISENPWLGTYFRLTTPFGMWSGAYPHNFFLESIMTFGIIGTIPLLLFVIKAFYESYQNFRVKLVDEYLIRNLFFSILFINTFLSLMSTGTILLNRSFWISLGAVLYFSSSKSIKV